MDYTVASSQWKTVFAVPSEVVDKHIIRIGQAGRRCGRFDTDLAAVAAKEQRHEQHQTANCGYRGNRSFKQKYQN